MEIPSAASGYAPRQYGIHEEYDDRFARVNAVASWGSSQA